MDFLAMDMTDMTLVSKDGVKIPTFRALMAAMSPGVLAGAISTAMHDDPRAEVEVPCPAIEGKVLQAIVGVIHRDIDMVKMNKVGLLCTPVWSCLVELFRP